MAKRSARVFTRSQSTENPSPAESCKAGSVLPCGELMVSQKPQRLLSLLRENKRLLSKIKQKKTERDRLAASIDSTLHKCASEGLPIVAEIQAMGRQIHALFDALLARQGQARKTQKLIHQVYGDLIDQALISSMGIDQESGPAEDHKADRSEADSTRQDRSAAAQESENEATSTATECGSAARAREGIGGSSLRTLFHRLAEAMHPDKVQDEWDIALRTEAMKELTQAYQAGDVAKLLSLEQKWLPSAAIMRNEDVQTESDIARRCAQLERTNQALRSQLDHIQRALRSLRRTPQAAFLSDLRQHSGVHRQDPAQQWISALQQQKQVVERVLTFVRAYHEGTIDIEAFSQGPDGLGLTA